MNIPLFRLIEDWGVLGKGLRPHFGGFLMPVASFWWLGRVMGVGLNFSDFLVIQGEGPKSRVGQKLRVFTHLLGPINR